MRVLTKAAIVSALVSLVVTLGNAILFAQATSYSPGVAAKDLEGLKYFDAVALLESQAQHTSGLSAFLGNAGSLWFWQNFVVSWVVLTGICLACCLLFARWARR